MAGSYFIINLAFRLGALAFWLLAGVVVGLAFGLVWTYYVIRQGTLRLGTRACGWVKSHLPTPRKTVA